MKLIGMLLTLWSFTAFSTAGLFNEQEVQHEGGSTYFSYYHGTGTVNTTADGAKTNYLVSLTVRYLGDGKSHLVYHVVTGNMEKYFRLILKRDHELLKVYVPANKSSLEDLGTYKETGWGYLIDYGSERPHNKRVIFLHYMDEDGNRKDHHIHISTGHNGRWILHSSGTIGNATDGMILIWNSRMRQIFER